MAEGDYKPMQQPFAQSFSPRQGQLYKGAMMRNLYTQTFADGSYAVRRSGLNLLGAATDPSLLNGALVMGLITYGTNPGANWAANGWMFSKSLLNGQFYMTTYYFGRAFTVTTLLFANTEPMGQGLYWCNAGFYQSAFSNVNFVMQSGSDIFTGILTGASPPTLNITRQTQAISNMMPGVAFLDGAVYVMSQTDNQIHGCALQDPTTWNALNVVGASTSWGRGVGISRHLNYILGFFEFGLQVYYDAGLAPPASPLAPLPNASFLTGLAGQNTVVSMADCTVFVGRSGAGNLPGNLSVYMLSGLQLGVISTPMVDAALAEHGEFLRVDYGFDGDTAEVTAMPWSDKGTNFYVLTFPVQMAAFGFTTYSLAYNLSTQEWVVWTNKGPLGVEVGLTPWVASNNLQAGPSAGTATGVPTFTAIDPTMGIDYGLYNISALCLTAIQDFQSVYKKFVKRLSVQGDTIPEVMTMRYSDDDYTTYSGYYTIDLSKQRKKVERLGSFYQRSFEFEYHGVSPFRMRVYELEVSGGSN